MFIGWTIPSFRIASEMERWKWRPFRHVLGKKDRKIFDEMFSYSRLYNAAGTMACRPVLIQVVLISIIFEHYKRLSTLTGGKNKKEWKLLRIALTITISLDGICAHKLMGSGYKLHHKSFCQQHKLYHLRWWWGTKSVWVLLLELVDFHMKLRWLLLAMQLTLR